MLADSYNVLQTGRLKPEVHRSGTIPYGILDFIEGELPYWRNRPDRKPATREEKLSEYLCVHLDCAAGKSMDWAWVAFYTESHDEIEDRRKIDLVAKPRYPSCFEGRLYTQFDTVLPIECKRLSTPKNREYVTTKKKAGGGIQRFKFCHHGAKHNIAGMIAYIQEETCSYWLSRVNGWIHDLAEKADSGWSNSDSLEKINNDPTKGICTLDSWHDRSGIEKINLRHIWIVMNL